MSLGPQQFRVFLQVTQFPGQPVQLIPGPKTGYQSTAGVPEGNNIDQHHPAGEDHLLIETLFAGL